MQLTITRHQEPQGLYSCGHLPTKFAYDKDSARNDKLQNLELDHSTTILKNKINSVYYTIT